MTEIIVKSEMSDEEKILHALRVPPKNKQTGGGAFKIEVHWGAGRTVAGPNKGMITIWESGKRFHGGGDEKMYWCGYQECRKPIRTQFFAQFHVVCPHCKRECMLDPATRASFMKAKGFSQSQLEKISRMPEIIGERLFRATPKKVAEFLALEFRRLASDADIYMKYHPTDIRCRDIAQDAKKIARYHKAREARNRGLLIYPLHRIMKDIAAGATLESRFLAMCVA